MKIIRHLDTLPDIAGSVVTIGNFDGLHLGHRKILDTLRAHGRKLDLPTVAMTFEPHPLKQIAPSRAPTPLSTPDQRIRLIDESGVDILFIQEFGLAFSRLSPEDFIARYLVEGLKARLLCVGHNFRFGHQHRGSMETLRAVRPGFDVIEVPQVSRGGEMVSSSRIRQCLADGDVSLARRLLGRCYEIEGDLVSGDGRGSRETVPTLNMRSNNDLVPQDGVYFTQIRLPETEDTSCPWVRAVTNVGIRPTFEGEGRSIETFALDQTIDVAAGKVALKFLRRLRNERRFADAGALRQQILMDADAGRRFFHRLDATSERERLAVYSPEDRHDA